jgi:hypothetical protein
MSSEPSTWRRPSDIKNMLSLTPKMSRIALKDCGYNVVIAFVFFSVRLTPMNRGRSGIEQRGVGHRTEGGRALASAGQGKWHKEGDISLLLPTLTR